MQLTFSSEVEELFLIEIGIAETAGKDARRTFASRNDNPYEEGSNLYVAWDLGWRVENTSDLEGWNESARIRRMIEGCRR